MDLIAICVFATVAVMAYSVASGKRLEARFTSYDNGWGVDFYWGQPYVPVVVEETEETEEV